MSDNTLANLTHSYRLSMRGPVSLSLERDDNGALSLGVQGADGRIVTLTLGETYEDAEKLADELDTTHWHAAGIRDDWHDSEQ